MAATGGLSFEGLLIDAVWARGTSPGELSRGECARRLVATQRRQSMMAADDAATMLRMAALTPDEQDPQPGTLGARSTQWRQTDPDFPGVSESFPDELGQVLQVGRGTAAHRLRRAVTWRDSLPRVGAALRAGEIDERRAGIFADRLQHTDPVLAGRVEQVVLPEAMSWGFGALQRRIAAVLLELDPQSADDNRKLAEANSDVFLDAD